MKISYEYSDDGIEEVIEITAATYKGSYIVEAIFNDGTSQLVNFEAFLNKSLHPSISKYLDEGLFSKFEIKDGNLNWNNFDLIFPVHDIYTGTI